MSSTEYLLKEVQEKVIKIDSSRDIDTIHNEIVDNVDNYFDFNI